MPVVDEQRGRRAKSANRLGVTRLNVKRHVSVMRNEDSGIFTKDKDGSIVVKIPSMKKMK